MKNHRLLTLLCTCALAAGTVNVPMLYAEDAESATAGKTEAVSAAKTETGEEEKKAEETYETEEVTTVGATTEKSGYRVIYRTGSASGKVDVLEEPAAEGETVILSVWALRKDGFTHTGWTDGEKTYRRGAAVHMPDHDLVLEPVWKPTYKLTFEDFEQYGYASPFEEGTVSPGTKIYLPNLPMHNGDAIFEGYYINDEFYPPLTDFVMPESDVYISVCWLDPVVIDYVSGDLEGVYGNTHYPVNAYPGYGMDISSGDRLSRFGYKLDGWYDPDDNNKVYEFKDSFIVPDHDMTLMARWVPIKIGMKFKGGEGAEGTMPNQIAEFGSCAVLNECTYKKEGYKLLGWKHDDEYYLPGDKVKVKVAEYGDFMVFDAVWVEEGRDPGDLNADGQIDVTDLSVLSMHVIGDQVITDEKTLDDADVQRDEKVDLADLARMKQFIMQDDILLGV